ncbi:PIN domain-containing protein [Patescibacteria group bacterium AH-259-L07]|nr:PIN domain-containing protein [Patescibacteria group bacterium AH-259-L07]
MTKSKIKKKNKHETKDDIFQIRITDKGAVAAIFQVMNTLILIMSMLSHKKIETVKELVEDLKFQLQKTLKWMERIPDGSLYKIITKKEVDKIKKDAKEILGWKIVPTEKQYKKHEKILKEYEEVQVQKEERLDSRVKITFDTSFLLSHISKKEKNYKSTEVIVNYLTTQKKYFDIFLPNLVILEFISKLKQKKYTIRKIKKEFSTLLDNINDSYVELASDKLNLFEIFNRYQKFARKDISTKLKSNDFIIATDSVLAGSIILTCDKEMYKITKKFYNSVFLITPESNSYLKFLKKFENEKKKLYNHKNGNTKP